MANGGRREQVFLVDSGLQPCELVLVAEGKGAVNPIDRRAVMTMDGTTYARFFKKVQAGGEVVVAEGTFERQDGRYRMMWGTFDFRDLEPGRYSATVKFESVIRRRVQAGTKKVDEPKNIWLGTVSSQPVTFELP